MGSTWPHKEIIMTGIEIVITRLLSDTGFRTLLHTNPDQALEPYQSRLSGAEYDLMRRMSALISLPAPALLKDLLDPDGGGGTQGNWWSSIAVPAPAAP